MDHSMDMRFDFCILILLFEKEIKGGDAALSWGYPHEDLCQQEKLLVNRAFEDLCESGS